MGRMESRWKVEEWGGGEMRVNKKKKAQSTVRMARYSSTVLHITGDGMSEITLSCDMVCVMMMMMLGIFAKR